MNTPYGVRYRVLLERESGGWIALAPAFPGIVAEEATDEAALQRLGDLLSAELDALSVRGEPFPPDETSDYIWDEEDGDAEAEEIYLSL